MRRSALFILCALSAGLRANGVTGADVLKAHPSARAAALGDAYTGLGDDLGAMTFNPAGLASLKGPSLGFLHHAGIATVSTEHVAYAHPLESMTLGGSLLYRSQADIVNPLAVDAPVTVFDVALSVAFATRPSRWLKELPEILQAADAGISLKYLRSHLGRFDADAVAADIGIRGPIGEGLIAGLSVVNLGPPIKFIEVADPLPGAILLGVSRSFQVLSDNRLLISADAEAPFYSAFRGHFGLEDWLGKTFALRGGYLMDTEQSLGGLSGGFGLKLDQEGLLFQFDYAYRPFYYDGFNSFEGQHLFQMSLGF
jgi:hypothetical protein